MRTVRAHPWWAGAAAAIAVVLVVVPIVALTVGDDEDMLAPPVTIAVGTDSPGMHSQDLGNRRAGFDVDFYRWIAATADDPFVPTETDVNINDRINALRTGQARMVFSSFAMTDDREPQVDFAGPYLLSYQGVLVRRGDTRIARPTDLAGKNVCAQNGSTSVQELRQLPGVSLVPADGLDQCIMKLQAGGVDAVSTSQILLYGWERKQPELQVVPGLTFGAIGEFGIGLPPGPGTGRCEQMTRWVRRFIDSGQWDVAFRNNFPNIADPGPFKPQSKDLRPCVEDDDEG